MSCTSHTEKKTHQHNSTYKNFIVSYSNTKINSVNVRPLSEKNRYCLFLRNNLFEMPLFRTLLWHMNCSQCQCETHTYRWYTFLCCRWYQGAIKAKGNVKGLTFINENSQLIDILIQYSHTFTHMSHSIYARWLTHGHDNYNYIHNGIEYWTISLNEWVGGRQGGRLMYNHNTLNNNMTWYTKLRTNVRTLKLETTK